MVLKTIKPWLLFFSLLGALSAQAQDNLMPIDELDADNLPTESVIPVLDSEVVVRNRLVSLEKKVDIGLSYGLVIDEMFYDNKFYNFAAFYNLTDESAFGIKYFSRQSGQSDYAKQFSQTVANLNFNKAPAPSTIYAASYRYSFLYGKVSFTKSTVLPMTLDMQGDLGMHKVGSQQLPYSAIGLAQRFFIEKHWGIGLSYRIMIYQNLDPVSANIGVGSTPSESDFSKKIQISQTFGLDLSYLF